MSLYVPLDVDFATDPKFLAAGPVAGYLYISSLAFSKRTMNDGKIDRSQLVALAIGIPKPEQHADRLVEVGLWTATDDGWRISSWLKRNKSRAQIEKDRARKREHGQKANHERWHVDGKTSPTCPFCDVPDGSPMDPPTDPQGIQSGLQVETESEEETKEEAEASAGIGSMIDVELASRLERRRREGEDIGPALERLIRDDVVRDVTLLLSEPTPKPALKRVFVCDVCSDTKQVRNDNDLSKPPLVPCSACQSEAEAS